MRIARRIAKGEEVPNSVTGKLKRISKQELLTREIIIAGVQSLIAGENPRIMEQRLMGYLPPKERTSIFD